MKAISLQCQTKLNREKNVIIAHFFSNSGTIPQRSFESLLKHLLERLLEQETELFETIVELVRELAEQYQCNAESFQLQWSVASLKNALLELVANGRPNMKVLLIVDALDECDGVPIRDCLAYFQQLTSPKHQVGVKVCFSSRHFPEELITGPLANNGFVLEQKNSRDISNFVNDNISFIGVLGDNVAHRHEIKSEILRKADGIFLWVKIVLQELESSHDNGATFAELKSSLVELPDKLHGLYQSLLAKIGDGFLEETNTMLALILSAQRPLTLSEFRMAIAFSRGLSFESQSAMQKSQDIVQSDMTMKKRIRSRTGGILEVAAGNGKGACYSTKEVVQVIHQSVKDFLMENVGNTKIMPAQSLMLRGHQLLLQSCLGYLKISEIQILPSTLAPKTREKAKSKPSFSEVHNQLPFVCYAVTHWFDHAKEAEKLGSAQTEAVEDFVNPDHEHFENWTDLYNWLHAQDKLVPGITPLYLAVRHGFVQFVRKQVQNGVDVNQGLRYDGHYLQLAVEHGNEDMVNALLDLGADIDAQGGDTFCALHAAVLSGNKTLVKLLLDRGADMHISHCSNGWVQIDVLYMATFVCEWDIIKLLLDRGYETYRDKCSYHSALMALCAGLNENGNLQETISSGTVDPDTLQIMTHLSKYGLDFTAALPGTDAALLWLLVAGSKETIEMMIARDASMDTRQEDGLSLLHMACMACPEEAVRNLVEYGADITAEDAIGHNILFAAVANSSESVLRYVLTLDLDCNVTDYRGVTPLHLATAGAPEKAFKLLLEAGADPTAVDLDGFNILHYAMLNQDSENRMQALKGLLANINAPDAGGITPLHLGAEYGTLMRVEWALELGANVNAVDNEGRTVLHAAATHPFSEREGIMAYLLDHGADLEAVDDVNMTALHHALYVNEAHVKMATGSLPMFCKGKCRATTETCRASVQLLLDRGAKIDAQDVNGNTALHLACSQGMKSVVDLLLSRGAKTDLQDHRGCAPLDLTWDEEIREILEER